MTKFDPLERLQRVLEDINEGASDALGNEVIGMENKVIISDAAFNALQHINTIVGIITPYYEPPSG